MTSVSALETWLEKAQVGLVPKKVQVHRAGKTYEATRYVRPEQEKAVLGEAAAEFVDFDSANAWSEAWKPKLSSQEQSALAGYRHGEYIQINSSLRGTMSSSGQTRKLIAGLDSAMKKSKLPTSVVSYRGVRLPLDRFRVGEVFSDAGFVSTTLVKPYAAWFAERSRGVGQQQPSVLIKVLLPAGTNAVYTGEHEAELLLPRGSQFLVKDTAVQEDGLSVVTVELHRD